MKAEAPPPSPSEDSDLEPLEELAEIVAQLREHIAFQELSGADGLPRDRDLKERLRHNPLPDFSSQARPLRVPESTGDSQPQQAVLATDDAGLAVSPPASPPKRAFSHDEQRLAPSSDRATSLVQLGKTLEDVRSRVSSCTLCELHLERTQTVFSRGTGSSGLCFVGEGPGADEDAQGEPFVGAAGQLLDKMILAMGFERDEVYVCNVVKCRPPKNRKPTPFEMQTCVGYLHRQLELIAPQVIVALGGTAVEGLLGITQGITKTRGNFRLYQGRIAVMPTFHPAYLLRNPSAKRQVWADLQQVLRHMGRTLP